MKRKMLSILLALCMVCSLLPVTAMADEAPEFGYAVLPISYAETFGKIVDGEELPALDDVIIENSADYALCMKDDSGNDLDISSISFEWWYEASYRNLVKVPDGHEANTEDYSYYLKVVVETEQAYTVADMYDVYDNLSLISGSSEHVYRVEFVDFPELQSAETTNSMEIIFYSWSVLPEGTVKDKNGMAYYYDDYDGSFVIWGEYLKSWKQTSYGDYYSYLVEGEYANNAEQFAYDSTDKVLISETENLEAKIKITPVDGQQLLEISYTVTNNSDSEKNYAVGTTVDVQIGENDGAAITPFTDGKAGFKLLEGGPFGAQFNFFGNDVTSFWYGPYSKYSYYFVDGYEEDYDLSDYLNENVTNVSGWSGDYYSSYEDSVFKSQKRDSLNADSVKKIIEDDLGITVDVEDIYLDSAVSWRWNGTLATDETVTHSVYIGIGEVGSDDDVVIPDTDTPAPQPPVYYPSVDPTPVIPSVDVDIHDDTLSDAAKAVGSAVKSGKADFTPVAGYTKEDVIQMQKDNALKLVVEKKSSYDPAEKSLIDTAAQEKGKAPLVQFLEIDVTLRTMNDVIVAEVDDTVVPLSITVDLNAEMQKAAKEGKTIYVARAHDGKVAFLEGTLNADKTKVTFDSSKFSTYALVASDSQTVTSPQTADAGIFLAVSMSVLSVTGSAVLLKKKED